MGFAFFSTPDQALADKDILQDMLFDPDTKSILHTEIAKKNLVVKRGIGVDAVHMIKVNAYGQLRIMHTLVDNGAEECGIGAAIKPASRAATSENQGWRLNAAWKIESLEAEVRVLRYCVIDQCIMMLVFIII